ncbi:MAG: SPOR domain-containing protein [Chitinophagales bacterium]|jgi:hypothetical protein|nr:SPOR domain-containing protein [Chitinophagales bacterium]
MNVASIIQRELNQNYAVYVPGIGLLIDSSGKVSINNSHVQDDSSWYSWLSEQEAMSTAEAQIKWNQWIQAFKSGFGLSIDLGQKGKILFENNQIVIQEEQSSPFSFIPSDFFNITEEQQQVVTQPLIKKEETDKPILEDQQIHHNEQVTHQKEAELITKEEPVFHSEESSKTIELVAPEEHVDDILSEQASTQEDIDDLIENPSELIEEMEADQIEQINTVENETQQQDIVHSLQDEFEPQIDLSQTNEVKLSTPNIDEQIESNTHEKTSLFAKIGAFFSSIFTQKKAKALGKEKVQEELVANAFEHLSEQQNSDQELIENTMEDIQVSTSAYSNIQNEQDEISEKARRAKMYDLQTSQVEHEDSINWKKILLIACLLIGLAILIPFLYAKFSGKTLILNSSDKASIEKTGLSKDTLAKNQDTAKTAKDTSHTTSGGQQAKPKVDNQLNDGKTSAAQNQNAKQSTIVNPTTPKIQEASKSQTTKTPSNSSNTKPNITQTKNSASTAQTKGRETAIYKPGYAYLGFGSFSNISNASQLQKDLINIGIVTDVIKAHGAYKVCIPFRTREEALRMSQNYRSTVVFE